MASIMMALVLSFFVAGLGIVYEGDMELGIGLILLWLIFCLIALYSDGRVSIVAGAVALIVWTYSIFATFFKSISI